MSVMLQCNKYTHVIGLILSQTKCRAVGVALWQYVQLLLLCARTSTIQYVDIEYVMKNGRLYEGSSLNEVYPRQQKAPAFDWQGAGPNGLPGVLGNE